MTNNREAVQNPIITIADQERFPFLEMASKECALQLTQEDEEAIQLMNVLLDTLDDQAAGLAAVQIGYPRRIFLLRNACNADGSAANTAYINPIVVSRSRQTKKDYEGCLSLPHFLARFDRPKSVVLEYMDINGEFHRETFTGFWARAVMHEMDHLDGVLITHEMEKTLAYQVKRSKFGMILNSAAQRRIAKRRAKKKFAKAFKKNNRSTS